MTDRDPLSAPSHVEERQTVRPTGPVSVRRAVPDDAPALLALQRVLDHESEFMLLEPDERQESAEQLAAELAGLEGANATVLLAEEGGELVGYVAAKGGAHRRDRITATLVLGVAQRASGRGVGTALLAAIERWAAAAGLHRLELTVMVDNERAIRLYRRRGFTVEGRRRQCLLRAGSLVDELSMAKLLGAL